MRELFPGYSPRLPDELSALLNECFFVFDTNVLFNLYRYSTAARDGLLAAMRAERERVWLPHHVAWEFHHGRTGVIDDESATYADVKKDIESVKAKLTSDQNHPFIAESLLTELSTVFERVVSALVDGERAVQEIKKKDDIYDAIEEIFDGKIGPAATSEEVAAIELEGEKRYESRIPPGYLDKAKKDNPYGDLIIWKQLIEEARRREKAVIFITDDNKDDWWLKNKGERVGLCSELEREFVQMTGQKCHAYSSGLFYKRIVALRGLPKNEAVVEEIRKVASEQSSSSRVKDGRKAVHSSEHWRIIVNRLSDEDLAWAARHRAAMEIVEGYESDRSALGIAAAKRFYPETWDESSREKGDSDEEIARKIRKRSVLRFRGALRALQAAQEYMARPVDIAE